MSILAPITSTYAGILGLYYLKLSFNIGIERKKAKTSLGDGSQQLIQKIIDAGKSGKIENFSKIDYLSYDNLLRSIRAHGNFGEFVPFALLFSLICEINGISGKLLNGILFVFTLSRFAHATGLRASNIGRKIGVIVTVLSILILSILSIYIPNKDTICILGLYYLKLSIDAARQRFKSRIAIGDGTNHLVRKIISSSKTGKIEEIGKIDSHAYDNLLVAIRSQGNFGEYTIFVLLFSLICELNGVPSNILNGLLLAFTISRFAHVSGLHGSYSMGVGRKIGVLLTVITLLSLSSICIYYPNQDKIHNLIKNYQ
ncbi:hypothetical protein RB653_003422 [Dictyostelium firmibasis]|uniref:Uncharacterized protein n=1 Tax=Dictyostelium firmibasis TaxID=79012 RepID=A0AAN7YZ31_9MYCE